MKRATGQKVTGTADVDRVIALVHPGRLEQKRDMAESTMSDQVPKTGRPDLAGTDVFMTIQPRSECGLRIVQMNQAKPSEADPRVELLDDMLYLLRIGNRPAGSPEVRRVEAETDAIRGNAARREGVGDPRQLVDRRPDGPAGSGRVLQDEDGCVCSGVDRGQDTCCALGESADAVLDRRVPVRPGVHVHKGRSERRCDSQFALQQRDGSLEEVVRRPREIDEIRGVDGNRGDSVVVEPGTECGLLNGRLGSSPPGRRIVRKDLEGIRPDLVRSVDRPDHPGCEGQVGADPGAMGIHRFIVAEAGPTSAAT